MKKKAYGFTIVELLIVIVIIAILAAITLVSYNGITQRANNSAIISAAEQSYKLIEAYIAANGTYPLTTTATSIDACITSTTGCADTGSTVSGASTAFDTALQSIGTTPKSVASVGSRGIGIRYNYSPARTFNGQVQPAMIQYFLLGEKQQCGLSMVASGSGMVMTTSTTGYYSYGTTDGIAKTSCVISVPGPSA